LTILNKSETAEELVEKRKKLEEKKIESEKENMSIEAITYKEDTLKSDRFGRKLLITLGFTILLLLITRIFFFIYTGFKDAT
jgi:hypothetical protein